MSAVLTCEASQDTRRVVAALAHAGRGYAVFPCHNPDGVGCSCGDLECDRQAKHPRTVNGFRNATTDPDQIRKWWDEWPDANIGIAAGALSNIVVLDVDPRHAGDVTLQELEHLHGPLPATSKVATGGGGWHFMFAYPGRHVPSKNNVWPGIDVKADGGYVIGPGSMHISGGEYFLEDDRLLAEPPEWVLAKLDETDARPAQAPASQYVPVGSSVGGVTPYARAALDARAREVAAALPGARNDTLNKAAFRMGHLVGGSQIDDAFVREVLTDAACASGLRDSEIRSTLQSGLASGARDPEYPDVDWPGWSDDISDLVQHDDDPSPPAPLVEFNSPVGDDAPVVDDAPPMGVSSLEHERPVEDVPPTDLPPVLPELFWGRRGVFQTIREAARSRLIAPDGVLVATLMRIAALTDFRILLPDVVGRHGSLNSAAVLVAPSGGGKGSTLDTARDLLPEPLMPVHRFKEAPVGSGEGMTKVFFEQTKAKEGGKQLNVWEQRYDAIAFRVDEGEMLKQLGARQGQTTMTVLRSAWSGEQLGNSYADRDRRGVVLEPHGYRVSIVMGVQPEHADALFDDTAGGTPQRFLWVALVDPTAPSLEELPTWPGALTWKSPDWEKGEQLSIGGRRRSMMTVADSVRELIQQHRQEVNRGHALPDPLDAHRDLVQLKTAGLLAALDHRLTITEEDWELAGTICDTSRQARDWTQREIRRHAQRTENASNDRAARKAVAVDVALTASQLKRQRVTGNLIGRVERAGSDGITRGRLRAAITSKDRNIFDAALEDALASGEIALGDDDRYRLVPEATS